MEDNCAIEMGEIQIIVNSAEVDFRSLITSSVRDAKKFKKATDSIFAFEPIFAALVSMTPYYLRLK